MGSTAIVAVAVLAIALSTSSAAGVLMLGGGQQTTPAPASAQVGTPAQDQQAAPGGARAQGAKTTKPTAKTTKPIAQPAAPVYTKQQCRDAVYRWVKAVQKSGASATGGWYDASLGSEVKKVCGGCIKKDEAGLMFGKAIGVKRYPDQWDDTKISRVADDSFHSWAADYITEGLPGTCSSA